MLCNFKYSLKPQSHYSDTSRRPLITNFFLGAWGRLSSFVDDNLRQPPQKVVVRGRRLVVAIVWLWLKLFSIIITVGTYSQYSGYKIRCLHLSPYGWWFLRELYQKKWKPNKAINLLKTILICLNTHLPQTPARLTFGLVFKGLSCFAIKSNEVNQIILETA